MARGIIRDLVHWSDFDECWVNSNDLYQIEITAPELIEVYNDALYMAESFMTEEQVFELRKILRKGILKDPYDEDLLE